jgi:hypothetical protein
MSTRLRGASLLELGAMVELHSGAPIDESGPLGVDAGIWIVFGRADGVRERWDTGMVYHEISVDLSDARTLQEHLEPFIRDTAKDDLVADMRIDGYEPDDHAVADLRIDWIISPEATAQISARREQRP